MLPWSQSELDNLLDLTELGHITHNEKGEWFGGGRPFDFNYVQGLNIDSGREMNLLGFDDEIYKLMKPKFFNALYLANANDLRTELAKYNLSAKDIIQFRGADQVMTIKEFNSLIKYLNTSNSINLGDKLLNEWGIDKNALERH